MAHKHEYKVGIIGCGGISSAHSNGYKAIATTKLIAAAEINEERLQKYSLTYGVSRLYKDYRQMLAQEALDIVSICTWPGLHCEMTLAAAQAGVKGILCEKPMAMNLEQADKMIDTCDKAKALLVIGHQHRFDAQSVKALEVIKSGAIGELQWIFGHCGSDLLSNGTHVVDLIKFFVEDSPVKWVMGQLDRTKKQMRFGHNVEDMAIGHFQFENGVRGFIEQGDLAPQDYAFHIYGTSGMISVNAPKGRKLRLITQNGEQSVQLEEVNSYKSEIEELIAWIEGGKEHRSGARRSRETTEVLMAIMESSKLRQAVNLPLENKKFPLDI